MKKILPSYFLYGPPLYSEKQLVVWLPAWMRNVCIAIKWSCKFPKEHQSDFRSVELNGKRRKVYSLEICRSLQSSDTILVHKVFKIEYVSYAERKIID